MNQFNDKREEVIVAAIISNTLRRTFGDVKVQKWKEAGLLYPSAITGNLLSIKKTHVEKKLGALAKEDLERFEDTLRKILKL